MEMGPELLYGVKQDNDIIQKPNKDITIIINAKDININNISEMLNDLHEYKNVFGIDLRSKV